MRGISTRFRRLLGGLGLADGRGGKLIGIVERQVQQDPVIQRDDRKGVEVDRSLPGRGARLAARLGHTHRIAQRAGIAKQTERLSGRLAGTGIANQHRRKPTRVGVRLDSENIGDRTRAVAVLLAFRQLAAQ